MQINNELGEESPLYILLFIVGGFIFAGIILYIISLLLKPDLRTIQEIQTDNYKSCIKSTSAYHVEICKNYIK